MNRIKFPLQPQAQGDAVADLHEGLQLLLKRQVLQVTGTAPAALEERLRVEQTQRVYGPSTRLLVSLFQQSRGMPASGSVDEPTANGLNTALAGLGAFASATVPGEALRVVAGQVRRDDGRPVTGAIVRAVHLGERGAVRLGDDVADQAGRYAVRYQMVPGVASILLQVTAVDQQGSLLAEVRLTAPAQALEMVDLIVPAEADSPTWRVSGRVTSRASASTGGLRVRIVDKVVGGDVPLADALTDDDGRYEATFLGTALRKTAKTYPDLQARVFAGDQFVGASAVRYNASVRERLDVVIAETAVPALRSEHDTVTAAVARHFKGKLADLKEDAERSDVTFLANKTGWDARAVALASLAAQFSARTVRPGDAGLDASLFYAMFRAGLPANESALYRTDVATLRSVWKKAVAGAVIAPLTDDALKTAVDRFSKLAVQRTLDAPALVGVSSLKELLAISLASPTQQERFAELYTRHRTDMPKFWTAATDAFGEPLVRRLRLDGQLAYLTLNNAPLIQKVHAGAGRSGLTDAAQLVDQGYHDAKRWQSVVGADKVPREIPGANDEERRRRYADVLAAQVRLSFPTRVVAQMVRTGETPVRAQVMWRARC
jgi:hypothetical protein